MVTGQKTIGVVPPNPGIAPEIEGAPVSMPGGNDGKYKTKMTGTPVTFAVVPPPVSTDLKGAPGYVAVDPSKETQAPAVTTEAKADSPSKTTDTDAAQTTDKISPEEQERADAVAGTDRQIKTIQDWMQSEQNRPETEEQRKKRERREKSKKIIAAVSDGISALSNLFFTTRYAPNMYNHERGSQLNATNERMERLKAEREKKRDEYLNFSLKLGDLENNRARTLRELEAQQEARKMAREKAQRDTERHKWQEALQPDIQREQAGKANRAEQQAIAAQAEAQYAPQMQEAKLNTEKARAGAQQASAAASRASAANSYASARSHDRSNRKEFYGTGKNGKEYSFATEKAAIDFEYRQGTYNPSKWGHDVIEETTVTGRETSARGKKSTKKKVYPQKKQSPTAGGGGGKKSPTA
ncbi:MAG: hypothetical protein HDS62_02115 [Bacteroidales bacterium]|nr:hypothetical protein [Bacteroidales bacterium]